MKNRILNLQFRQYDALRCAARVVEGLTIHSFKCILGL
jgi:hypothetical protein